MTKGDPAEGFDPRDLDELARLFRQIREEAGEREVTITDSAGLTDSVTPVRYPGAAADNARQGQVLLSGGGNLTVTFNIAAEAVVTPAGVNPSAFRRMLTLAGKVAAPLGLNYMASAAHAKTDDQFWAAMDGRRPPPRAPEALTLPRASGWLVPQTIGTVALELVDVMLDEALVSDSPPSTSCSDSRPRPPRRRPDGRTRARGRGPPTRASRGARPARAYGSSPEKGASGTIRRKRHLPKMSSRTKIERGLSWGSRQGHPFARHRVLPAGTATIAPSACQSTSFGVG